VAGENILLGITTGSIFHSYTVYPAEYTVSQPRMHYSS